MNTFLAAELKRTGNLYLLTENTMNLLIQLVNQIFPINDLDGNSKDMSHYNN